MDQVYSNTRVPTRVRHDSTRINTSLTQANTSQHESTRVRHESTRISTSPTPVNTSQHEPVRPEIVIIYCSLVGKV